MDEEINNNTIDSTENLNQEAQNSEQEQESENYQQQTIINEDENAPTAEGDEAANQFFRPEMVESSEASKKDKINTTYILLAIFIVLLGISYIVKNKQINQEDVGEDKKIIVGIEDKNIDKIEISKNGETTVIENEDDLWKVSSAENFSADQNAIASLLNESLGLNKYIIASDNADKQADFEVDEENGINVKLYASDEKVADFFVGKAGPDFDSTYIRLTDENVVYLSKSYVCDHFDKADWRNLTVYDFDSSEINKIALKYRDVANNVLIEKENDKWQIKAPVAREADSSKVSALIDSFSQLMAKDVELIMNPKECGFAEAPLVVRIELQDGSKKNLIIGGKVEGAELSYAKREEDNTIYEIDTGIAEGLMKKESDF